MSKMKKEKLDLDKEKQEHMSQEETQENISQDEQIKAEDKEEVEEIIE